MLSEFTPTLRKAYAAWRFKQRSRNCLRTLTCPKHNYILFEGTT